MKEATDNKSRFIWHRIFHGPRVYPSLLPVRNKCSYRVQTLISRVLNILDSPHLRSFVFPFSFNWSRHPHSFLRRSDVARRFLQARSLRVLLDCASMVTVLLGLPFEWLGSTLAGVLLAGNVQENSFGRKREGLSALEYREQAYCEQRTEDPYDTHDHPARKELLAEDIATAIHGHWPEDQEGKTDITLVKQRTITQPWTDSRQHNRHCLADFPSPEKLLLLGLKLIRSLNMTARGVLQVEMGSRC